MAENASMQVLIIVGYSAISLCGLFGNLLVVLVIRKPGMITVSNIFITNLSVADFAVCLINIPFTAVVNYSRHWPFGAVLCRLMSFLFGVTIGVSIGTLVAIAGERYWHIVRYTRRSLTVRKSLKAIAVIWIAPVVFFLPLTVFSETSTRKDGDKEIIDCGEEWPNVKSRQAFTMLLFLCWYLLPLLLISGLYIQIGRFLRNLPLRQQVNNRAQKKTIRMLITVVLLFGICGLPFHIVFLYMDFSKSPSGPLPQIVTFCQWLIFANSACNPVVYAVLNEKYRREFASLLCRSQNSNQVLADSATTGTTHTVMETSFIA